MYDQTILYPSGGCFPGLGAEPQEVGNIGYVMLAGASGLLLGMLFMYVWRESRG